MTYGEIWYTTACTCATMSLQRHGSLGMGVTDGLHMAEKMDSSVREAMYLVSPEDCSRSGIFDITATPGLENFGKSRVPVNISGCYKVTWNGSGIRNAEFAWIPL